MAAPASLQPRTWVPTLLGRMRRLQLHRVQPAVLAWVVACWLLAAAVVVALLWPGALAAITGDPVEAADGLLGFAPPTWFRVLACVAGAALAGAAIVVVRTRRIVAHGTPSPGVLGEVAVGAAVTVPVVLLAADRAWLFAVPALLLAAAAEATMRMPGPRAIPALLGAGTWLVVLAYQFTEPGADGGSWVWIALFGGAAAFAAFGAYYGVARAAESRSRALAFLFREHWHPLVVLGIAAAAAVVVVLRMTVLRELFPVPDPLLWAPWERSPLSWLFAAVVVGMLVLVAIRSTRHPLVRFGQRRVTAGLAVLGNLDRVLAALLILLGLVAAMFGPVDVPREWAAAVPVLKIAGVAALALVVLLPRFRGTAARWLSIVAALFLLPNTVAAALGGADFAPTPVQVTVLLVAVSLALALANVLGARLRPSLVARFAIVPLVAVHAGWLLPAVWTQFGLVVAVVGILIALLVLQPPAAKDPAAHSARILTGAALQLLGLGVALVAAPSLLDDPALVVLGLVWLSVVVVAALCFETVPRKPVVSSYVGSAPATAGTEPTDDHRAVE